MDNSQQTLVDTSLQMQIFRVILEIRGVFSLTHCVEHLVCSKFSVDNADTFDNSFDA